jgi:hypothetical protein
MGDTTRRDAFEASIRSLLPAMSLDELRVLERVAVRLHRARESYGELQLVTDQRDFRAERANEAADALFYICADDVRRHDIAMAELEDAAALEISEMDQTAPRPKSPPESERIAAQLGAMPQ